MVQTLGKGVEEDGEQPQTNGDGSPSPMLAVDGKGKAIKTEKDTIHTGFMAHVNENIASRPPNEDEKMMKEFGRLVVEEGRSRYVSNKFWSSLSEEVGSRPSPIHASQ